jgi:hypothetical protein
MAKDKSMAGSILDELDKLQRENAELFDEVKYLKTSNDAWERIAIEMQRELDGWWAKYPESGQPNDQP